MISTIYIEEEIINHPRVTEICARFPKAEKIPCGRYGEIFNPNSQNFRLQKARPALVLAKKFNHFVLNAPDAYRIGAGRNYYFSHMLNCVYDCRYCFLQGMYRSAHYVHFVNDNDFKSEIEQKIAAAGNETTYFFSGYDCDSLALDSVTQFTASFLPFFRRFPNAWLELRTKSIQTRTLLTQEPLPNCVVAFSFTPEQVSQALEHGVPSIDRRIQAMVDLAQRGWKLGLRFDPIIYEEGYQPGYLDLFYRIFEKIKPEYLHSVSLGPFRLPKGMFDQVVRLYPDEPLFSGPLEPRGSMVSYSADREAEMSAFCLHELSRFVPEKLLFPCPVRQTA
jgi:spore photoproduct lyase